MSTFRMHAEIWREHGAKRGRRGAEHTALISRDELIAKIEDRGDG